jgi:F0F1-type ATP synthase assembly protein I
MSSRLISGVVILLVIGVMAATVLAVQPPAWIMLLLGSMALALLYIVARLRSRFDPLDPRFGSCIPPITKPRDQ